MVSLLDALQANNNIFYVLKNNIMILKYAILVFLAVKCATSARILGVFPLPGVSHYILTSKLMKGLAEAGHDITIISPYKLKDPPKNGKFNEIVLDELREEFQSMMGTFNLFGMDLQSPLEQMIMMTNLFVTYTNKTLYQPQVRHLLQSDAKFDAVILEQFSNDALKVFSYIYKCPLIILSSMGPNAWVNPTVGNPQPISYVPHLFLRNFVPESIIGRAKNMMYYVMDYFVNKYYMLAKHEEIMHQAFPDAPPLYDLYTNVSLILLNSHTSLTKAVPVVPNMVEIGGYFIDPPQKLPKDLQDFLDGAKDGAIYFSMGSNLKSKDLPAEKKKAILNVLKGLKQKVLWKFEEDLPEKPDNVMIRQWCPQQDILAHPNIGLFISHGGLLSTTETVYHGVPILAIPVFGDQPANADKAVENGFGLKLEYNDPDFSEEKLKALIKELLENPKYKENAQTRSKVFHDRPHKPMETAAYWVEYVIRHRGAPHLRVAGVRMPWYQYFMVDVIGILLLTIFVVLFSIMYSCKKICCKNPAISKKKIKTK